MVKTIITLKLYTSIETYDGKEFQDLLNKINSGVVQRDWVKSGVIKSKMSYISNRKKIWNQKN